MKVSENKTEKNVQYIYFDFDFDYCKVKRNKIKLSYISSPLPSTPSHPPLTTLKRATNLPKEHKTDSIYPIPHSGSWSNEAEDPHVLSLHHLLPRALNSLLPPCASLRATRPVIL